MARPSNRSTYKTAFGQALDSLLSGASRSQTDLAKSIDVSAAYVNLYDGRLRTATPELVERVAGALDLGREQRQLLHCAAAKDAGYDIDGKGK